jgi:cytochrome c-type biogenesis protein CcmH
MRRLPPQDQLPGTGATGALRDPDAAGRPQERVTARDNDAFIMGVEKRLRCTCGCNLDVYTCRTTDFSCGVSPRMHREVLALQDEGQNEKQIVDTFVARYGEVVLMAPKPEGFNLAGYFVPGVLVVLAGGALAWYLRRRSLVAAAEGAGGAVAASGGPAAPAATTAEAAELERALREDE